MASNIDVVEIFSSIQGEGLYVGCRQVFVRLAGCNMVCNYCDTPLSRGRLQYSQIETCAGSRVFAQKNNPLTIEEAATIINSFLTVPHHSISLTGGEPLCQALAIVKLAKMIKGRLFLETNGTLPEELALVLPYMDIISMDIKLPSSIGKTCWHEHQKFLLLAQNSNVYVKVVVTAATTAEEFDQAVQIVRNVDLNIPLIIQPVTPSSNVSGIQPELMLTLHERAANVLADVRVIPQTHKFTGQL